MTAALNMGFEQNYGDIGYNLVINGTTMKEVVYGVTLSDIEDLMRPYLPDPDVFLREEAPPEETARDIVWNNTQEMLLHKIQTLESHLYEVGRTIESIKKSIETGYEDDATP